MPSLLRRVCQYTLRWMLVFCPYLPAPACTPPSLCVTLQRRQCPEQTGRISAFSLFR